MASYIDVVYKLSGQCSATPIDFSIIIIINPIQETGFISSLLKLTYINLEFEIFFGRNTGPSLVGKERDGGNYEEVY